jgi:hypothetical protein
MKHKVFASSIWCFEANLFAVLKLFGVFSHAEIDRSLWQVVGRHLHSRGPEHRKR